MQKLNTRSVALALGSFMAIAHLGWAVLIAIGWAKPIMDFILSIHHININYSIDRFSIGNSLVLIIVTFFAGYIGGWVFAAVWNGLKK